MIFFDQNSSLSIGEIDGFWGAQCLRKRPADGDLSSWNRLRAATENTPVMWAFLWLMPTLHSFSEWSFFFFCWVEKWREKQRFIKWDLQWFISDSGGWLLFFLLSEFQGKEALPEGGGSIDDFTSSYSEPKCIWESNHVHGWGPWPLKTSNNMYSTRLFVSSLEYLVDSLLKN